MSEKFLFARLDNKNYQVWKIRMEMFLKREDTWFTIGSDKPDPVTAKWTTADQKAQAAIILYVDDNQLGLVRGATTAKDTWKCIKDFHEKNTMTSRVSILRRICSLNMPEGGDAEKHLFDLDELFDRLTCAGLKLEVPLKVAMIYRSLPESYGNLVTALESRADEDQTIELVKQKVLDEHQRRSERSISVGENALKLSSSGRTERTCYYCGKPGHILPDCSLLKEKKQQESNGEECPSVKKKKNRSKGGPKAKQAAESEVPVCFMAGSRQKDNRWFVDSGCSSHMTNERAFFTVLNEDTKPDVALADGSTTSSSGIGEGVVKCIDDDGGVLEIALKEVLYVPTLDSALLSVRKLTQEGLSVNFGASRCTITSGGKVVAIAELWGALYVLKEAEDARLGKVARHSPNCHHTWHRRFGHRYPAVLERMKSEELCEGLKVQDCGLGEVCERCLEGKSSIFLFPKASQNRAGRILDLIHTDVCGPMKNTTPGGARYLMTLIDDCSRYTVVCLLRQKSDAAGCIKRFVAHVKTRFGRAPCVIRSDGGGEYVNRELKEFYELEGIQAQFTAALSPQQYGVSERRNRSLQEMATCMLLDAGLPERFWGEAVATATYLQNRLPSRAVERTPYEAWFGTKPSVDHLRVFGSPAYVLIPDGKRFKLDSKAQRLLFVGYCDDQNAYRFVDPKTNGIMISRDAHFVELGKGSLMGRDPVPGDSQIESVDGEAAIQEEPVAEDRQQLQIVDKPQVEENRSRLKSEDELYGWDDEAQQTSEPASEEEQVDKKRSTRGVLPKRFEDYEVDFANFVREEPSSYEEAVDWTELERVGRYLLKIRACKQKSNTEEIGEKPSGPTPIMEVNRSCIEFVKQRSFAEMKGLVSTPGPADRA